ncbi:hypothetical protein F5B22DRAFT_235371 [Xylaria bambusicola]|uniref:uncharacterized protein n=1 Tax=Xylaria bambusicola TaxID=326684 RepID=UPI0020074B43|nr:uncharacterized protein F5B22DRAFT_235371 [Xylaria bambusicola]KAI0514337.1 hypothetical protein F5B22DRAFT_235371 [Xylaria bambusicola]
MGKREFWMKGIFPPCHKEYGIGSLPPITQISRQLGKAFQVALKDIRCHTYLRMRKTQVKVRNKKQLKERTTDRRISYIKWKARYAQRMLRRQVTFKKFSSLPTEIRLKIWEQYVLTPRIIKVVYDLEFRLCGHGNTLKIDGVKRGQVCPLLLVNRESRYAALREPLLLFSFSQTGEYSLHFAIRPHDIMFFHHNVVPCPWMSMQGDTSKIANIMFHWEFMPTGDPDDLEEHFMDILGKGVYLINQFRAWDSLQNLYFLVENSRACLHRRFGWDDLHEAASHQFSKHNLWMTFPERFRQSHATLLTPLSFCNPPKLLKLREVWKTVSIK